MSTWDMFSLMSSCLSLIMSLQLCLHLTGSGSGSAAQAAAHDVDQNKDEKNKMIQKDIRMTKVKNFEGMLEYLKEDEARLIKTLITGETATGPHGSDRRQDWMMSEP